MFSSIAFIYPSEPFALNVIDPEYEAERKAATEAGFSCVLMDIEELEDNKVAIRPNINTLDDNTVYIYRGWMLSEDKYATLANSFERFNKSLIVSTEGYLHSHYLPNWYDALGALTMKTVFTTKEEVASSMEKNLMSQAFVKDYVKSLTTSRGSIANSVQEALDIVKELEQKRSFIEGGICLREVISLKPETEERYFVFNGKAFARQGDTVPEIVEKAAALHLEPFFSVDVVEKSDGQKIIVEIGDGQVSDVKKWDIETFYKIFTS